jgi:hypothetical protein
MGASSQRIKPLRTDGIVGVKHAEIRKLRKIKRKKLGQMKTNS